MHLKDLFLEKSAIHNQAYQSSNPPRNDGDCVRLIGAANTLHQEMGAPLDPAEEAELDQDLLAVRNSLEEKEFAVVWSNGKSMTLEQALTYALKALKGEADH